MADLPPTTLEDRLEALEEVMKISQADGNWNYNPYMWGMTNGLILAFYIMKDFPGTPPYKECPPQFLEKLEVKEDVETRSL